MLETIHLSLPAATDDLRKLQIGTVAYLSGRIFSERWRQAQRGRRPCMGHARILCVGPGRNLLKFGVPTPAAAE